ALVSLLLGVAPDNVTGATEPSSQHRASPTYKRCAEARCINPNCVSVHEPLHAIPQFIVVSSWPLKLRCIYCDREYQPPYVANNTSGRSSSDMKRYHSSDSSILEQVRLEDLIFFNSELEAQALGFRPAV
ncbi:MAG: hypothetical protein SVY53_08425, partial [Chloroflexota bacterium]|nr:hypothetical protein [Chloroflexota bacterium]